MQPKAGVAPYAGMAAKQIAAIRGLVGQATEIIHAGDPGREGQMIVDEVLEWVNNRAPVRRLWLHAQTPDGIKEAFARLKPNTDYANLFHAARCRAEADWIVGMNCTRGWTLLWRQKGHQGVANVGRVKTPTLGLVVERDLLIENFQPVPYHTIEAQVEHKNGAFTATWVKPDNAGPPAFDADGRLIDRQAAQRIASALKGQNGVISRADKTRKKQAPPLLPSLGILQRLASKFGYSPEATLAAAQDLYDKYKLTTYPRTDCTFAPVSEWAKAPGILSMLQGVAGNLLPWKTTDAKRKSAAWNDAKLGEHFAIIPTGKKVDLDALPKREREIFQIVMRLYAAQFMPDYEYLSTIIEVKVQEHLLRAAGAVPVVQGWKAALGDQLEDEKEAARAKKAQEQKLPDCAVKDPARCSSAAVLDKKTAPPPPFTADSLLEAMENAHRYVQNPNIKAKLKQVEGIGTPATRAGIIQSLVKGEFSNERNFGKSLQYHSTDKGKALIAALPSTLKHVDFTALLEGKLEDVASGSMTAQDFRDDMRKFIDRIVLRMRDGTALAEIGQAAPAAPAAPAKSTRKTGGTPGSAPRKRASPATVSPPRKTKKAPAKGASKSTGWF
jgi:DNA topoisomerase-3